MTSIIQNIASNSEDEYRQLPHNLDAEQQLLGALLVNNDLFDKISSNLKIEHFFEHIHGVIFDNISKLILSNKLASPITLKTQIDNDERFEEIEGSKYLIKLAAESSSIINIEEYAQIIRHLYTWRNLIDLGNDVVNVSYSPPADMTPYDHLEYIEQKLYLLAEDEKYGIDFIIRGFVQGSQERLRTLVQMTDTNTNETVWSDVFDFQEGAEIFDVQDEISIAILSKLNVDINSVTNALKRDFSNAKAFQNYIFARSKMLQWTPESHAEALRLIEVAAELEPNNRLIERFYGYWYWGKTIIRISENKTQDLEKALQIAESVGDFALAGYAELGLGRQEQACKRPDEMQNSGMLKTEVFNLAAAGRISARCGELTRAKQYFEKSLSIGPHYAGWVKVSYTRLLVRMQLFDEALAFTSKYMDSEFSAKTSQHAIQLFRAYALSKTNKPKQAKKLVENVITQNDLERTKKFFERTLNSSKDSDFVTDIMKTLQAVGFN